MNPDLMQVVGDPTLYTDLNLTEEQQQMAAIIKHHYVLQDQFTQLTKHIESIYGRLAQLEKVLANKVLS